jgi:hypothetical protein
MGKLTELPLGMASCMKNVLSIILLFPQYFLCQIAARRIKDSPDLVNNLQE